MTNFINHHFLLVLNAITVFAVFGMFRCIYVYLHEGLDPALQLGGVFSLLAFKMYSTVNKALNTTNA